MKPVYTLPIAYYLLGKSYQNICFFFLLLRIHNLSYSFSTYLKCGAGPCTPAAHNNYYFFLQVALVFKNLDFFNNV